MGQAPPRGLAAQLDSSKEAQMLKGARIVLVIIVIFGVAATLQAQCPGYNPAHNTNLACEIATASRSTASDAATLSSISATLATQLSQLPIAAAASGTGVTIGATGLPTVSTDSLGTILTQRGRTIGRHQILLSFNFQRFGFESVDGISLHDLPVVVNYFPAQNNVFLQDTSNISFRVDQFTAMATFGLTSRVDVSLIVPFSNVHLATATSATLHSVAYVGGVPTSPSSTLITPDPLYLPGSATGIGDIRVNVKANILGAEGKTSMAIGSEVRFPSGDAVNYLGTGAYGFKPYLVISHRARLTPNVNIGYQWNGNSVLNFGTNLPASFLYSGGVDFRANRQFTLTGEFLGQYVIDAPRLTLRTIAIPLIGNRPSVKFFKGGYAMDNAAFGFKVTPFKGLVLSASALVKLDDAGLRSRVVPLFGAAYR